MVGGLLWPPALSGPSECVWTVLELILTYERGCSWITTTAFRVWTQAVLGDLPAELGRLDGTPVDSPQGLPQPVRVTYAGQDHPVPPRLDERATAVGLRSRSLLDPWLR